MQIKSAKAHITIPSPCFRVDRLSHRSQNSQRLPAVLLHQVVAEAHEAPDGCWGCVEDGDLVLVCDVPRSASIRVGWDPFEDDLCCSVKQWSVCDI